MSHTKILIAGGTGFIGQALVRDRLKRGDKVTVLGRNITKIEKCFGHDVAAMVWDDVSAQHLIVFDIIINLTGANIADAKWTPRRKQTIIDSRVHSTEQIAHCCAELGADSPRLLNASAVGIYGLRDQTIQDEDSTITRRPFTDFLNKVGYLWEQATNPAKQAGVNVVNMRFGVVLAKHGGMLKKLMPIFKFGLGGRVGTGQQILSWVSLTDLIHAIDFLILHRNIVGPVNIVAPEFNPQIDFAQQLAKSLNRPCILPLPSFMVKLIYGKMGDELLLHGQKVTPKKLQQNNFDFQHSTLTDFFKQPEEI